MALLDPNKLFRRETIHGRTYEFQPMSVYDAVRIGPGTIGPDTQMLFRFVGHPGTAARPLADEVEEEVLAHALAFPEGRRVILEALGLDPARAWCLLGTPRKWVSETLPPGKPGDFDLIAGHAEGDRIGLRTLVEAEVKRRPVRADGSPGSFPSGLGVSQATGAAELGFDRVALLHLLSSPQRPLPDGAPESWQALENGDFIRAMRATVGMVRKAEEGVEAPYGLVLLGWADLAGTEPILGGSISPVVARRPPDRPLLHRPDARRAREAITAGLRQRLCTRRPWAPLFRLCGRCGEVFAPEDPRERRCC